MTLSRLLHNVRAPALACAASLLVCLPAAAAGHFAGGGGGAQVHASGFPRGPATIHGGFYRGGYGGWRGAGGRGWYGRPYGFYGGWGLGLGLGYGLYVSTLPFYYSTLWWGGVPYYYADNTYYRWNDSEGYYVTVPPPEGAADPVPATPAVSKLFAYPKNGQTEDQQSRDEYECHTWAAKQTGYDPIPAAADKASADDPAAASATTPAAVSQGSPSQAGGEGSGTNNRLSNYLRAQTACLEAHGYSVR
jgi:hypothetical protein